MIRDCLCKSPFQDRQYGQGRRLHTESEKKGPKCTVCGTRKAGPSTPPKEKK